jgi:hypothetical protein
MNDGNEAPTDICYWCGQRIVLSDGVWSTIVPAGAGINRCEKAPGVAKFHLTRSLAEEGDIVVPEPPETEMIRLLRDIKTALTKPVPVPSDPWTMPLPEYHGFSPVWDSADPAIHYIEHGRPRLIPPETPLHHLLHPAPTTQAESVCTNCHLPIIEGGHGLWVSKPNPYPRAWPGRCGGVPGIRHQPREEDLPPEVEELRHVPEHGEWYKSRCTECGLLIWRAMPSELWAAENGGEDPTVCSPVVDAAIFPCDPHEPSNPAATTYATCRHCRWGISRAGVTDPWQTTRTDECPARAEEGVTVEDAIDRLRASGHQVGERVNAGPAGDWLRGKVTITQPAEPTRFTGELGGMGKPAREELGLFFVEECDETDPAPGLRLIKGGSRVGRMSYPEGVKLALDILVKARYRLAILEEGRGTADGPHDQDVDGPARDVTTHSHVAGARCEVHCPAYGTSSRVWRA